MRGSCTNGDGCRFSHDITHIQAAQGQVLEGDVHPDTTQKGYKTTLCRFFLSGGRCTRGELCSYAHGVEELRGTMNEKNLQIMVDSQQNNELHMARKMERIATEKRGQNLPRGLKGAIAGKGSSNDTGIVQLMAAQAQAQAQALQAAAAQVSAVTREDVSQAIATLRAAGFEVNDPDLSKATLTPSAVTVIETPLSNPLAPSAASTSDALLKVYLDKTDGDRLGINIDQAPEGILVTACEETGLVAVWNQYRPEARIDAGDKIISVNGTSNSAQAMLQEIKKNQILLLTVKKNAVASAAAAARAAAASAFSSPHAQAAIVSDQASAALAAVAAQQQQVDLQLLHQKQLLEAHSPRS